MLGAVAIIGGFLITMMKGGAFAQGQTVTLNDARNTVQAIEKEVRSAESLVWCAPAGSCLRDRHREPVGTQPKTVKYTHTGTDLQRAVFDARNQHVGHSPDGRRTRQQRRRANRSSTATPTARCCT